jgi:hypothetical protein
MPGGGCENELGDGDDGFVNPLAGAEESKPADVVYMSVFRADLVLPSDGADVGHEGERDEELEGDKEAAARDVYPCFWGFVGVCAGDDGCGDGHG